MGDPRRDGTGRLRLAGPGGSDHREGRPDDAGRTNGPGIPLEIAASYRARTRGLLGRTGITGALLLTPAASVHTLGMRFPIDVAYLDRRMRVLAVRTMPPGRLGRPRLRARHVLEAEAGAMAAWGLVPGSTVTVETAAQTKTGRSAGGRADRPEGGIPRYRARTALPVQGHEGDVKVPPKKLRNWWAIRPNGREWHG